MNAHTNPAARVRVCTEMPDWRLEIAIAVCGLCFVGIPFAVSLMGADHELAERERLARVAAEDRLRAVEKTATVRLEVDGLGYRCKQFNIRREWEVAVAAECAVMGSLLQAARATP